MRALRKHSPRPGHHRRGIVYPLAAVIMIAVLAMVMFTVDVGYIVHIDTELQRTADACALGAVVELPDKTAATSAAKAVAIENIAKEGADVRSSDVVFGVWDRDTATFSPKDDDFDSKKLNAVMVTVRRTKDRSNAVKLFFAPLFGRPETDVQASAIAMFDKQLCGPLVGIEWIDMPGDPVTDSYRSAEGPYSSSTARDEGSLCSDGPIAVDGQAIVNGDANPGRGHNTAITGSGVVTGNKSPRLRPLNLPPVDTSAISVTNDNEFLPTITKGNSQLSPVDGNGNFLIDGGQTYTVPAGRYYLNDFTLTGNSNLYFEGPTTIYLTGNLDTAGGYVFNSTQVPSNVRFFMTGGTARVTSKVDFYGTIYAPNTAVTLDGSANWFGGVVGKTLEFTGSGDFHYDEDLKIDDEVGVPKRLSLVQ